MIDIIYLSRENLVGSDPVIILYKIINIRFITVLYMVSSQGHFPPTIRERVIGRAVVSQSSFADTTTTVHGQCCGYM